MRIDLYSKDKKTVFNAELNWNNTITVTMIVNHKKSQSVREFAYKAGGKEHLYLDSISTRKYGTKFTFTLNKGNFGCSYSACVFIVNSITKLVVE